ncbi:hypothetical protein FB45DRAFT_1017888 [Roridomyces roridus]|uniref:Uncharacterized protein n=1 Tax=Roridomyces roridus TaxID=1738132 RepID=A0AAD7CJE4_9AGAR|nr:hypothetical protein FB45DRAFT_1017888 [Roridomyces roridus]
MSSPRILARDHSQQDQASHRCIRDVQICEAILANMEVDKESLLAIALTCRFLHLPALQVSWRIVTDIERLLSLWPSFKQFIVNGRKTYGCEIYHPRRSSKWTTFRRYANFVRNLFITQDVDVALGMQRELLEMRQQGPLLPNLKSLVCSEATQQIWQALFLGHSRVIGRPKPGAESLEDIRFDLMINGTRYVPGVGQPHPLSHLHLQGVANTKVFNRFAPHFNVTLTHLRIQQLVALPALDPEPHGPQSFDVDFLPVLQSLTIDQFHDTGFGRPFPPFMALRHLKLYSASQVPTLRLLRLLGTTRLETVLIHGRDMDESICEIVAARWSQTLTLFDFNSGAFEHIHALRACTALRTFCLAPFTDSGVQLHGTFPLGQFLDLASGWNALRNLSITGATSICFTSLGRLARLFPALAFLQLDWTEFERGCIAHDQPSAVDSGAPIVGHGLKHLLIYWECRVQPHGGDVHPFMSHLRHHLFPHLSPSPWRDLDQRLALARALDGLFPRLDSVLHTSEIGSHVWVDVMDAIFEMQDERANAKSRAARLY